MITPGALFWRICGRLRFFRPPHRRARIDTRLAVFVASELVSMLRADANDPNHKYLFLVNIGHAFELALRVSQANRLRRQ